jgi:hypothetical protein
VHLPSAPSLGAAHLRPMMRKEQKKVENENKDSTHTTQAQHTLTTMNIIIINNNNQNNIHHHHCNTIIIIGS